MLILISWQTIAIILPPGDTASAVSPLAYRALSQLPSGTQSPAKAKPYPRRPFKLRDRVPPNSSFYQFRERLKQAIRERNAKFIRAMADPNIKITFGSPIPFSSLKFDDSNSLSWKRLERIMSIGCTPYEAPAGVKLDAYQCPHVSQASLGDPFTDVYIVGENINVRAQPRNDSQVIGVLSDEVVKSDPSGFSRLTQQQRQEQQTFEGWQPIITPTGQRGYVSSRYAYYPAGYRARFENKQGQWKMTVFIAGD
ncbi:MULTISPECIES: SH3 domain-containing protein [Nostocales]|uniref:SH3 domain-containing protein n=2 Tax=Tolypothrix TaxID=111782 RepID=A0A8S9TCY8_9CYAN|nr:SH3 domain-containing protein [Tolypothrix bouteillei]KAF3890046.1 SH3 domain-containing protein [Tolypothrix bouteillei VB521301]